MACGGAEEGQRRSRVPWREGRACSEKPVEEQSKLASVTRSLMASSTWRRREPAERRRGGAPGGAEVRRGRAFFSRLPCVSRASNLGTSQRRSSCQQARDAHGDLRKKCAVRFANFRARSNALFHLQGCFLCQAVAMATLRPGCSLPAAPQRASRLRARCAASGGDAPRTLTPAGVVTLSTGEAEAERARLEAGNAFAELVALSSKGVVSGQPPTSAAALSTSGLKKPPWLRQRAPQGERCALHARCVARPSADSALLLPATSS